MSTPVTLDFNTFKPFGQQPQPTQQPAPSGGVTLDMSTYAPVGGHDPQPGLAAKAWEWANHPLLSQPTTGALLGGIDAIKQYAAYRLPKEIASGNPIRAGLAQFFSGSIDDTEKLLQSFTSPVNIALMATGAPEVEGAAKAVPVLAKSLSALRTATLTYYGLKGAQEALTGQLPGETAADAYQRRMFGVATALAVGAHGALKGSDIIRKSLVKSFGLDQDLAGRVADHVQKMNDARQVSEGYDELDRLARFDDEHSRNVQRVALEQQLYDMDAADRLAQEREKADLEHIRGSIQEQGARSQSDFADGVHAEHVRLGNIFDSVEDKVGKAPVVNLMEAYKELNKNLLEKGVEEKPANDFARQQLQDYTPGQMDWGSVKELRNQLWREALKPGTTPPVRAALTNTIDYLLDRQETIAEKFGVKETHAQARQAYSQLMKDTVKSPIGRRLLAHATIDDVVNGRKLAAFTSTPGNVEIVKRLFGAYGVDTKPLDTLYADQEKLQTAIRERRNLTSKEDRQAVLGAIRDTETADPKLVSPELRKAAQEYYQSSLKPEPGRRAVVSGTDYAQLADKSAEELRRLRIQKLIENARTTGMMRPYHFANFGYGLLRLLSGSPWGVFMGARGGAQLLLDELYTNPRHAAWLASESGSGDVARIATALKAIVGMAGNQARNRDSGARNP